MKYKYSQYTINFFSEIDTEEKAYILGFIFADGNIDKKRNRVTIALQKKDYTILQKIKKCMDLENNLYYYDPQNSVGIHIDNSKIKNDLVQLGCIPNKSLILKPPYNVPKRLEKHFCRGYIDGDGSFSTHMPKRKGNRTSYRRYAFNVLGTKPVLKYISDVLPGKCYLRTKGNIYTLETNSQNSIKNIGNFLYNDSAIYLDRKKGKFEEMKSYMAL